MPKLVVHGALLQCSQGLAPAALSVVAARTSDEGSGAATVLDHVPFKNIAAFGMCKSTANPQVAAATTAASGVLTPQPCVPVIPAPWAPGASIVTVDAVASLTSDSTCRCTWAGTIEVKDPGSQVDVE